MKMKRTVSFLLVLVMLLGLFAGCGQQGGETKPGTEPQAGQETTQPTQETSAPKLDPPRTAEDFIAQLSDVLKVRNIPVELVLEQDEDYSQESKFAVYVVHLTNGNGNYGALRIILYYSKAEPGALSRIQIKLYDSATEQEQEVYSVLSGIASSLCDEAMTEEMVAELFAAETAQSWYATYSGDIGSFSEIREIPYPEGVEYNESSVVFRQPGKLTHSILREHITFQKETRDPTTYEITYARVEECFFADKIISIAVPSVEELEQRINYAFATLGVPITCTLMPYGDPGQWRGLFRLTKLEDSEYTYPGFPYEKYIDRGWSMEEITDEVVEGYFCGQLFLWVDAIDPLRKDASAYYISFNVYDPAIFPEMAQVIYLACDPENGADDFSAIQDAPLVEDDEEHYFEEERVLQKEDYSIRQRIYTGGNHIQIIVHYDMGIAINVRELTGEELLNPALLEYEFMLEGPAVEDSVFNFYGQGYQTYFNGSYDEYVEWDNVLNDFLNCTRSGVVVQSVNKDGEYYTAIYAADEPYDNYELNRKVFRIKEFYADEAPYGTYELYMIYNTNVAQYLTEEMHEIELENLLRIPIGLSLMLDEALTAEEAIQLHTHAIEYDYIATKDDQDRGIAQEGFQVTVYGTGDVIHLLTENPETGANTYSAIVRAYAEESAAYAKLIEYLDD